MWLAATASSDGDVDIGVVELAIKVLRTTLAARETAVSIGGLVELATTVVQERDHVVRARIQPGDLEESRIRCADELRLALEDHGAVVRTGAGDADEDLLPRGNAAFDVDGAAYDDLAQPQEGEQLGAGGENEERADDKRETKKSLEPLSGGCATVFAVVASRDE